MDKSERRQFNLAGVSFIALGWLCLATARGIAAMCIGLACLGVGHFAIGYSVGEK